MSSLTSPPFKTDSFYLLGEKVGTKAANSLAALTLIPTTDSSVTGCDAC